MEPVGFCENLGLLSERFPDRGALTVEEFAGYLGVNHKTVRMAIDTRKLFAVRLGRRISIPLVSAARFMCGR